MRIVTDTGADLPPEWLQKHNVVVLPLHITWENGESADDIGQADFYARLAREHNPPTTSQPSAGEFRDVYRRLAAEDPDILSVHISSGLSGTIGSARAAAEMVPEASVTVVDTLTLSGAEGWQVRAAVAAAEAGATGAEIVAKLARVRAATDTVYTLDTLHYLIRGGRIGRVKGSVGSLLNIKPLIAVEKEGGTYVQVGTGRGLERAMKKLVDYAATHAGEGAAIMAQVMHAEAPELASELHALIDERFDARWLPLGEISPVLGTHTGPGLVGIAFAPAAALQGIDLA
ncbi:MAG TPA: DegV family protein [Anaerolineae bacterium]|nr:DegV family protein [Anaerolineae bacterium]